MLNRFSLKTLLVIACVLLVLWWLWPSNDSDNDVQSSEPQVTGLISSIEPVQGAVNGVINGGVSPVKGPNKAKPVAVPHNDKVQAAIDLAKQALQSDDASKRKKAIDKHEKLIAEYPSVVEFYANLASLYAADGQLESARKILMQGINANKKYATLFTDLQKIYAAMTANAYKKALNEKDDNISSVQLALLENVELPSKQQDEQLLKKTNEQRLKQKNYIQELEITNNELAQNNSKLRQANKRLTQESTKQSLKASNDASGLSTELATYQSQLAELQDKLAQAQRQNSIMQGEHQTEIALLQQKIAEQDNSNLVASVAAGSANSASTQVNHSVDDEEQQQRTRNELLAKQKSQALALVRAWAGSWSDQDVQSYIAHYKKGYHPSGISHKTWVKQRQVRLSNKKYIVVDVSRFKITREEGQFRVTFSQRYRTNSMDDSVKKELVFKANGDDWSTAKIIAERVIK